MIESTIRSPTQDRSMPAPGGAPSSSVTERAARNAEQPASTADLIRALRDESALLVRQEIALAKVELKENAVAAGKSSAVIGVGAFVALLGLALLTVALAAGVAQILVATTAMGVTAAWLCGFLIAGVICAVAGGLAGYFGWRRLSQVNLYPKETLNHLKEETQCIKKRL